MNEERKPSVLDVTGYEGSEDREKMEAGGAEPGS
jgi:hypothetical protein